MARAISLAGIPVAPDPPETEHLTRLSRLVEQHWTADPDLDALLSVSVVEPDEPSGMADLIGWPSSGGEGL